MDFEQWLNAYVRIDECVIVRRKEWITNFVKNGLYPWIKSKGYSWEFSESHIKNCIATGLYENKNKSYLTSNWHYSVSNTDTNIHHYKDHFYHVINLNEWDKFWKIWGNMSDLIEDSPRGQDRRFDIQEFVWEQLDLTNSFQTNIINELLEDLSDDDYDDKKFNRVDTYTQESHEHY